MIVWPDLGPNCLSRLSADNTGRQRVKEGSEMRWPSGRVPEPEAGGSIPTSAVLCPFKSKDTFTL